MIQFIRLIKSNIIILVGVIVFLSSQLSFAMQLNDSASRPSYVLLSLSAHPDDEDGATLAYYARFRGMKVYSVFFTRGEGGQNEIGSELYEDLGALRTKETQAAAEIIGSEVYFLDFQDFGFSKTAKETFSRWGGHDAVLSRLVYYIRALKPDVVITNHDTVTTKPNRQHGNHQVVGITAYEAFEKAADSTYHPEQFHDGTGPWQVQKLYCRLYGKDTVHSFVEIDGSQKNTTGQTVLNLKMAALRQHRSQGMEKFTLENLSESSKRMRYLLCRSVGKYPVDPHDLFSGIVSRSRAIVSIEKMIPPPVQQHARSKAYDFPLVSCSPDIVVGLVATYDNTLQEILSHYAIRYTLLDSSRLASANLHEFTTILLDLRTYEYRTDARRFSDRLLEYTKNGGHLVCFYHKPADWNGKSFSPFPIILTNDRVTEEDAPVTILEPQHPLFHTPNEILPGDWDGWIQERNIYLPSNDTTQTSSRYKRLLAISDTDELQPPTSFLWTSYGKGTYTYTSLALYRQLRIHQHGALKLFCNLISQ